MDAERSNGVEARELYDWLKKCTAYPDAKRVRLLKFSCVSQEAQRRIDGFLRGSVKSQAPPAPGMLLILGALGLSETQWRGLPTEQIKCGMSGQVSIRKLLGRISTLAKVLVGLRMLFDEQAKHGDIESLTREEQAPSGPSTWQHVVVGLIQKLREVSGCTYIRIEVDEKTGEFYTKLKEIVQLEIRLQKMLPNLRQVLDGLQYWTGTLVTHLPQGVSRVSPNELADAWEDLLKGNAFFRDAPAVANAAEKWVSAKYAVSTANRITGLNRSWHQWSRFCLDHEVSIRPGTKKDGSRTDFRPEVELYALARKILDNVPEIDQATPEAERRRLAIFERIRREHGFDPGFLQELGE